MSRRAEDAPGLADAAPLVQAVHAVIRSDFTRGWAAADSLRRAYADPRTGARRWCASRRSATPSRDLEVFRRVMT